jgi:hypothetical protein
MMEVPHSFVELVTTITAAIDGRPLNVELESHLNERFPAEGPVFAEIEALCREGREQGWLCAREMGGIKFGRAVKAGPETHGFSVDVVEMNEIVGPEHRHPHGEIDLIMPDDESAAFDGSPRGWKVYGAHTVHSPTVSGGRAMILYLLPQGSIEFTGA